MRTLHTHTLPNCTTSPHPVAARSFNSLPSSRCCSHSEYASSATAASLPIVTNSIRSSWWIAMILLRCCVVARTATTASARFRTASRANAGTMAPTTMPWSSSCFLSPPPSAVATAPASPPLTRLSTREDACGLDLFACPGAVSRDTCNAVLSLVSGEGSASLFATDGEGGGIDGVDLKPCYQMDLIDANPARVAAAPLKRRLFFLAVAPLLRSLRVDLLERFVPPCSEGATLRLEQCFLRRYMPGERVALATHRDMAQLTINVLLSDVGDFTGGGCYVYGDEAHGTDSAEDREKCRVVEGEKQGTALIHSGQLMHGALPTMSGVRHILVMFFELEGGHSKYVRPAKNFKFDFGF